MHFPWDKLSPYLELAITYMRTEKAQELGHDDLIDLSIGTPVDSVPESIQQALRNSTDTPGYPKTVGSDALRRSVCKWLQTMRNVTSVEPRNVIPTVGSKEAVALLPLLLGLSEGDALVRPKFAYPTYDIGAVAAGCEILKLDDFDARTLEQEAKGRRIKLIWLNYPRNPTGECVSAAKMRELLEAARSIGAVVASDECYALFDWRDRENGSGKDFRQNDGESDSSRIGRGGVPTNTPTNSYGLKVHPSILDDDVCGGDFTGILMLYSLSKQLNLAGYRSSFIAGDKELVGRISASRKQLGLIAPEPIQQASIAALEDVKETKVQLEKYRERHALLRTGLERSGYEISHSEGSLYVWVKAKSGDCWEDLRDLASRGCIVAPGEFYDESAQGYLRISVTASDAHIAEFVRRIAL